MYTPVRPPGAGRPACHDGRPCPAVAAPARRRSRRTLRGGARREEGREREETGCSWPGAGGHARGGLAWTEPGVVGVRKEGRSAAELHRGREQLVPGA